jgi:hypothetical protein
MVQKVIDMEEMMKFETVSQFNKFNNDDYSLFSQQRVGLTPVEYRGSLN